MAIYFGGDHFVWAHQIGIVPANKTAMERWQKISLYSWALGSLCTVAAEVRAPSRGLRLREIRSPIRPLHLVIIS